MFFLGQKIKSFLAAGFSFYADFFCEIKNHLFPTAKNNHKPYLFQSRATFGVAALLLSVKIFSAVFLLVGSTALAETEVVSPQSLLLMANKSRSEMGISSLVLNDQLSRAAEAKLSDMTQFGYFDHFSPQGKAPWDFILQSGYNYIYAGENLAVNYFDPETLQNAWMQSPKHKSNILNRNFEDMGAAVKEVDIKGKKMYIVVQLFGESSQEKIVLKNAFTLSSYQSDTETYQGGEIRVSPSVKGLVVSARLDPRTVRSFVVSQKSSIPMYPVNEEGSLWQGVISHQDLRNFEGQVFLKSLDINQSETTLRFLSVEKSGERLEKPKAYSAISGVLYDPKNFFAWILVFLLLSFIISLFSLKVYHLSHVFSAAFLITLTSLLWVSSG